MLSDVLRFIFNQTYALCFFVSSKRFRLIQCRNRHDLELNNCVALWDAAIDLERRFKLIITSIIEAKASNAIAERGINVDDTDIYQPSFIARVRHQAMHAYHTIFRGHLDKVIV